MSHHIHRNKFFLTSLVLCIVFSGLTFGNIPTAQPSAGAYTVNGELFDFRYYPLVEREVLAIFNYLDTIVSSKYLDYGNWSGWNVRPELHGLVHYVLAFMTYAVSTLFESTPGYRTEYYRQFAYDLIKRMNTTVEEYGNQSIEYFEWAHPDYNYDTYYWPNATDPSGLYIGGFRGPANIMWTGHYALMMTLYERNFHTGEFTDEISYYINDWNNSLTTDGFGNPQAGGIWGTGMIPCEPYIVFAQCNSIPIYCTELYDNLYGTNYRPMWDYGLNFMNTVMQDQYGLFIDGYYVSRPTSTYYDTNRLPSTIPGPQQSLYKKDGTPKVSSYCDAWALNFLEYTQPDETVHDYPIFLEHFGRELSGSQMYVIDSYNNPRGFGTFDILGSLFTLPLAKQRGDFVTRDRVLNFLLSLFNRVWSADGRRMHFDTTALEPFLQAPIAFGYIWAMTPISMVQLAESRPDEFWEYPYISSADDERIWVYQALWDPTKQAFILNIEVDQTATLTFSNFAGQPVAYSNGRVLTDLTPSADGYTLTLEPGTYNLVIMEGA